MENTVAKLMASYGNTMTLIHGGEEISVKCFLQDTRSKGESYAQREYSPLGEVPRGMYLYLGPPDQPVTVGDSLIWRKRRFEFRRVQPMTVKDSVCYYWGQCLEMGGVTA